MTAFLLTPTEFEALARLRAEAARCPVELRGLIDRIAEPAGRAAHVAHMAAQTIELPLGYRVTFSIELGNPCGPVRHLSMSCADSSRVPIPIAVWMVAAELGFWGTLGDCKVEVEVAEVPKRGAAVNIMQPINHAAAAAGRVN